MLVACFALGLGTCLLALIRDRQLRCDVKSFLSRSSQRWMGYLLFAGACVIVAAGGSAIGEGYRLWRNSASKIEIPVNVVSAIEGAIEDGYLSRADAGEINDWLNQDVRVQRREIELIECEPDVAVPVESIVKVAKSRAMSSDDRSVLTKYICRIALDNRRNVAPYFGVVAVCDVLSNEKVDGPESAALLDFAAHASASYGLTPLDFGIPESHIRRESDHLAPGAQPVPTAAPAVESVPAPAPP